MPGAGPPAPVRLRASAARPDEPALVARMRELAPAGPRYGHRRVAAPLRAEGRRASAERGLWRAEGPEVPAKARRRRRLGPGAGAARRRAGRPSGVRGYDFVLGRASDGRPLKVPAAVGEFARECLALAAGRSLTGAGVAETPAGSAGGRGPPALVRSDGGPGLAAAAVRAWLAGAGAAALRIEPGSPQGNGRCGSFGGRLRDELPGREVFGSLAEAEVILAEYRRAYNHDRPRGSLGCVAPAVFASRLPPAAPAPLGPPAATG